MLRHDEIRLRHMLDAALEVLARLGPGVSERQVRRVLEELKDRGLVMSPGRGRSGSWKRAAEA